MRRGAWVYALIACCALGACAAQPSESSSESPTAAEATTSATSAEAPAGEATSLSTQAPTDAESSRFVTGESFTDGFPAINGAFVPMVARLGIHDGFERVVVEYSGGGGTLEWDASWVDEAISEGRGEAIGMHGEKILQINVSGVTYSEDMPSTIAPEIPGDAQLIDEVNIQPPFEGMHLVFLGCESEGPYAITALTDPMRLVIDVATGE